MPVVIDASAAAAWVLPHEKTTESVRLFEKALKTEILVPSLFTYEIRNMLLINYRRELISRDVIEEAYSILKGLEFTMTDFVGDRSLIEIGLKHTLTVYDSSYLAVAKAHSAALATHDKALKRAALAEGVEVLT